MTRISTSQYYDNSTTTMLSLQASIEKLTRQASGGRVLTPEDDPVAAARALDLTQAQSINKQFTTNRQNANSSLSITESTITNVITTVTGIKSQVINAGNASYSDSERADIATQLKGSFQELLGYANTQDGLGNYIFSGYKSTTKPFVDNGPAGVAYAGDQGVQTLQVDSTRVMNTTVSGQSVFQGKGGDIFTAVNNLMTVLNTPVTTAANNAAAALSQAKYDSSYATALTAAGAALTPPQTLTAPLTAAQLADPTIAAANTSSAAIATQAQAVYDKDYTRTDFPVGSTGALNQALAHAGGIVDQAISNAGTVRAGVGANQAEMDDLNAAGATKNVQYASDIATLMGTTVTDLTQTLSELSQTQTALLTAQKAFSVTSGLSLLNFLK